ncbi:Uu.00g134420.m01.CDS01 [Anthostomella pinea]|uniref:Uu.00g134420.m01.CDS01 n=1 Tax=Anthostomella pinea TaxID=933095 RepID=A0AAI8YKP8_9PEZI|nr:Uu.00g134420.m01.CDS01 [Anthostomella pinea]
MDKDVSMSWFSPSKLLNHRLIVLTMRGFGSMIGNIIVPAFVIWAVDHLLQLIVVLKVGGTARLMARTFRWSSGLVFGCGAFSTQDLVTLCRRC